MSTPTTGTRIEHDSMDRAPHEPRRIISLLLILAGLLLLGGCASTGPRTASPKDTEIAKVHLKAAQQMLRQGNPELALRRVLKALEHDPGNPRAYMQAGRIYAANGQPGLARKYYAKALELAPGDPAVVNDYARFLCEQGDTAEGERLFLGLTERPEPRIRAVAFANAGLCMLRIPDPDRAAQYFRAAVEADPTLASAHYQLARIYYRKGRYPQAQRALRQYFAYAKPSPKALLLGMRIAEKTGDQEAFQRYGEQILKEFPGTEQGREAARLLGARLGVGTTAAPTDRPARLQRALWIMARPPEHYTIRLLETPNERAMGFIARAFPLGEPLAYYETVGTEGRLYVLVYGDFVTRNAAQRALNRLPQDLKALEPRITRMARVQAEIQRAAP